MDSERFLLEINDVRRRSQSAEHIGQDVVAEGSFLSCGRRWLAARLARLAKGDGLVDGVIGLLLRRGQGIVSRRGSRWQHRGRTAADGGANRTLPCGAVRDGSGR